MTVCDVVSPVCFVPHRWRALIAANRYEIHDIVGDAPGGTLAQLVAPLDSVSCWEPAVYAQTAGEAVRLWDAAVQAGTPFDVVLAVLEPGAPSSLVPDFNRREPELASGIGLFHWVRQHQGDNTNLIAVVNSQGQWGCDTLFGLAASAWLHAYVLDRGWRSPAGGPELIPPINDDPRSASADAHHGMYQALTERLADTLWGGLHRLENKRGRGTLSKPLGHALAWLRVLCELDYDPNLLWLVGQPGASSRRSELVESCRLSLPDDLACPGSQKTVKKRIADTFDEFIAIAEAFDGQLAWDALGNQPAGQFWDTISTKTVRHFIDNAFNFLVFQDIDEPWRAFSHSDWDWPVE